MSKFIEKLKVKENNKEKKLIEKFPPIKIEEKRREEKILLIPGEAPRKLWTIINMIFSK